MGTWWWWYGCAAGMRVAYEVLRCVEMLGGQPSGPDYEALVAGAVAESNADVALELSERCAPNHASPPTPHTTDAIVIGLRASLLPQPPHNCMLRARVTTRGPVVLLARRAGCRACSSWATAATPCVSCTSSWRACA